MKKSPHLPIIPMALDTTIPTKSSMFKTVCCGEIIVRGSRQKDEILLTVTDNGMGIPEEEVEFLLTDTKRVHKKGSGVGLVNVNNRIKILFGEQYGLHIESELDEGTTVSIKIPAIIYSEENRKKFESSSQKYKQEET